MSDADQPKKPYTPPLNEAIAKARQTIKSVTTSLPKVDQYTPGSVASVGEAMRNHSGLTRMAELLNSNDPKKQAAALKNAIERFGTELKGRHELGNVRSLVYEKLQDGTDRLAKAHEFHSTEWKRAASSTNAASAKPAKDAEEKGEGIFARIAEKQNKWLEPKSGTTRSVVANSEILFGSVLALQGAFWVVRGLKSENIKQRTGPDGSLQFVIEPTSIGHKAGAVASGLAAVVAGMGTMAMGFSVRHP